MTSKAFLAGFLFAGSALALSASKGRAATTDTRIDFDRDIRPIVSRCAPCHFEGGVVYGKMPFDKPETIHRLGEKLFTRIKDEKEQAVIKRFLAQAK